MKRTKILRHAAGHLLRVIGGHGSTGRHIAEFADSRHAEMIIISTPRRQRNHRDIRRLTDQ
jgi:hypothetical protein